MHESPAGISLEACKTRAEELVPVVGQRFRIQETEINWPSADCLTNAARVTEF